MQTRLRIISLLFVASLLWTSPMSAATQKAKAWKSARSTKPRYIGIASWYGKQHQGRKMANGQRFDRRKLTAASWDFPLGTVIRVVNLENGAQVVVTITDRGPNHRLHRILDLSEAAAEKLDYVDQGLTRVFLYPMFTVKTQPAQPDTTFVPPSLTIQPVEYIAKASVPPM
jgi:peptidoglycan lytic transglycosylase